MKISICLSWIMFFIFLLPNPKSIASGTVCTTKKPIEHFKSHVKKPKDDKISSFEMDLNGDQESEVFISGKTTGSNLTIIYQQLDKNCYRTIAEIEDQVVPLKIKKNGYIQLESATQKGARYSFDPAKSEFSR